MDGVIFEFRIGNTYTRDFIISGYTDTIDNVFFSVKKADEDKSCIIQKTLNDGITLTEVKYAEDGTTIISRTYNLLLDADDTEGLKTDVEYPFDVKIISSRTPPTPDIKKTIVKGTLILDSATTRKWNEGT